MGFLYLTNDPKFYLLEAKRKERKAAEYEKAGKPHLAALELEAARHARDTAARYSNA